MKKNKKSRIFEITVCLLLIAATVLMFRYYEKRREELIAAWYPAQTYGFSTKQEFGEGSVWLSAEELEAYQPKTDAYNSGVCYDLLNSDEKIVYNALEYAWDNNYNFIYVVDDAGYSEGRDIEDIITLLSSDSPLLQQNIKYSMWETEMTFSEIIMRELTEKSISGDIVKIDNFTKERTEKVLKAVEEAKKTRIDFGEAKTDKEKASVIFDYIVENIRYSEDEEGSFHNCDHLYNAVVEKETICDGFSNMFSLLCNINGIKCFEKVYDPDMDESSEETEQPTTETKKTADDETSEGESAEDETTENNGTGHTWCVALLDGKWYNVDATVTQNNDSDANDIWVDFKFGFSDELSLYENHYEDILPECEESLFTNYIVVENYDDFVSTVGDAVIETENNKLYVYVKDFEKDDTGYKDYFQDLAYYTNSSVYSSTIETDFARVHYVRLA